MTMDALVIGCGYLGSRVARMMSERGANVFVTTRKQSTADDFRRRGWTPIVCDLTQPATLTNLPRVEVIVWAAALDRTAGISMRELYVGGLEKVLDAVREARWWVHVSSSSVYGQTDGGWIDEAAESLPEEPSGQVILEAETLLRQRRSEAMILRFSGIYGPGRLLRRKSIEAGETIVGDADKWLNLIHVEDGARAVLAAADRGDPGSIYNICDDEPVRRRDFYREMATLLKAPEPTFVPPPPGTPTPPHERGNRRLRNRRLREDLGVDLAYPNYRVGLADSIETATG